MREAFDQQATGLRKLTDLALQTQPACGVIGQFRPALLSEHALNTAGKLRGGSKLCAHERSDFGFLRGITTDLNRHLAEAFIAHDLTTDQESVALREGCRKPFFDFAQWLAAPVAPHANFERVGALNRTDVHADTLGAARVAQLPQTVWVLQQSLPSVVGAQSVASGSAEIETVVKLGPGECRVGTSTDDFGVKHIGVERAGAGSDQDVLTQNIPGSGPSRFAVKLAIEDSLKRCDTFDNFETVGGHQKRL